MGMALRKEVENTNRTLGGMMINTDRKHLYVASQPDGVFRFEFREAGEVLSVRQRAMSELTAKSLAIRLADRHRVGCIFSGR